MRLPELAVVDVLDGFPGALEPLRFCQSDAEVAIVEAGHLRRQPGGDMDAVGDVADGDGVFGAAGIEALPHGAGDFAVERGDGVGAAGELEAEHGHAEGLAVVAGMLAAEAHEVFVRDAELVAQRSEVLFDEVGAEAVVAGGDGRVGGEDDFAGNLAGGGVEVEAFFFHAGADGFEDGEAAVAFVEMENAGRDAHGLERAEAADAEQQLLADAGAGVAAVEARGGLAVFRGVAGDVGVEQEEIAAADLDLPDLGANGSAAGVDFDHDGLAVEPDGGLHGELVDVGLEVLFLLPALFVEVLQEVALAVEEADADEGNVEIGGALDVVAGEDAEAAGVDGQRLVDAELRGEVGDRARAEDAGVGCAPGAVGPADTPAGGGRRS